MKLSRSTLVLFLTPAVLLYALIFLYPTLRTAFLSLFEVNSFSSTAEAQFRGFGNYRELFTTVLFQRALINIALTLVVGGIAVFGLSFLFTVFLTSGIRYKSFFRAAIFLPNVINLIAVATVWVQYIYNSRYGFLHNFFNALGLTNLAALEWTSNDLIFWAMLLTYIWVSVGVFTLIILAGTERIPSELFEAARLEGANVFQIFWSITLPLIRDVLRVASVLWTIGVINLFTLPIAFSPVGQTVGTYTPAVYLYELAFGASTGVNQIRVGKAAAAGMVLLLLVLASSALINRLFRSERYEY